MSFASTPFLVFLIALAAIPAPAQTLRPDAGTLIEPSRPQPVLPAPAPPVIIAPAAPPAAPASQMPITPAAFHIEGNTVLPQSVLLAVLEPFRSKTTTVAGLRAAVVAVRTVYRQQGYLLTEVYLPAQTFAETGGTVTIQVLEARVGKVSVQVEGERVSRSLVGRIVGTHLRQGDPITDVSLERPILLLRDLAGIDATAKVEAGAARGEADIHVTVKATGSTADGSVGVDNFGARSAGQARALAQVSLNNPTGHGDRLGAAMQLTQESETRMYRVGYSTTVSGHGTRLAVDAARSEYALGKQFAALGAVGLANVYSLSLSQPLWRSRASNLAGLLALDHKDLTDRTTQPLSETHREVNAVRLGLQGNFSDAWAAPSFTNVSAVLTHGRVSLDAVSAAADQGPGGLNTAGSFSKVNVDLVRTAFFSPVDRITASLQTQVASKNLTSAEKMSLGGPTGVRGYPVGESSGDSGAIASLEYRRQFEALQGIPLAASVFLDWGRVRFNQDGSAPGAPSSSSLSAAGLGLLAGTPGQYLVSGQLAWRLGRTLPASDPDRRPRLWLSLQKWL